ncbi:MAG: type III pantothenate kinase [Woeseiaceae bacterium]|nr:type III pantothenate kinase [Woeseiaceae bacterium]
MLFDIGNTRLKWAVLEGGQIARHGHIDHSVLKDRGFTALTRRVPAKVDYILACNVAGPAFATRLSGVIGIHCGTDVHFARAEAKGYGVTNAYRQPRRLGVDRWVALVGARAETRSAVCIVDAGTAVTIDAMDNKGQHLGGLIIPGWNMMPSALSTNTHGIRLPRRRGPGSRQGIEPFGRSTGEAVQNGAISAICGAIERSAAALRSAGLRPRIVLTGGDASRILKRLDGKILHRPHLVLQGLARMVQDKA